MKFGSKIKSFFFLEDGEEQSIVLNRWLVVLTIFIGALITVAYVANVINIDNTLSEINRLNKNAHLFKNNNELLRTRLNYYQSPERIIKVAKNELGMIQDKELPELLP